jgi:hypothetical protein
MRDASRYAVNVFPSVAIVNHVHENDRFYAQAELVLAQEVSQAHIELKERWALCSSHRADECKSWKKCL